MLDEMRRQLRFHEAHPTISGYDPEMPWNQVFREAASNVEYWLEALQEPAWRYTEDRGTQAPAWTRQQQEYEMQRGVKRDWAGKGKGKGDGKPNRLVKEVEGREVCHKYNMGFCEDESCPWSQACAYCGSKHRSKDRACFKSRKFHDVDFPAKGKKGSLKGKSKS